MGSVVMKVNCRETTVEVIEVELLTQSKRIRK